MTRVDAHREEVIRLLTSLNERQVTIFKHVARIDVHLEKLNGQVASHEKELTMIKTWGGIAMFTIPILINIALKVI